MNRKMIQTAVLTVLATAGLAAAQYQVDRSGANDANNRIGSGGRNLAREQPKPWQLSSDTVYGNVTGGREFRGPLGSTDPRAFRAGTANRNSDNFIRDSAGVSTGGVTSFNATGANRYYGDSRGVAPPAGFTQIPGSGGYVPPRTLAYRNLDPRQNALSSELNLAFRPDQFGLPGPIDLQYSPNAIVVPSVVQARQLDAAQLSDYTQLNRNAPGNLSPQQLQQIQRELSIPQSPVGEPGAATPANPNQIQSTSPDDQIKDAIAPSSLDSAVDSSKSPELGVRNFIVGAAEQNSTYAQLAARRGEQEKLRPGQANAQAAKQFNDQVRQRAEDETAKKTTDQPTPDKSPDAAKTPAVDEQKQATPLKVDTLAGDKANGLNDILKKAEGQMREGKFASAIETYEAAEKVAPNNPLIKLGRSHAELAGGYYRRAEVDLRQTLSADKNLLAGQYDLRSFVGDDRLKIIEQDLRDLIQKNDKDTGAVVLLAYIYYNTANERRAAALLDLAEKRATGKDPFITLLKQNWSLPAPDGLEMNK